MEKPRILHFLTPLPNLSPFDVNMACDAGFAVAGYTNITLGEVTALTQDAMFSRAPQDAAKTVLFIGGRDAMLALDMAEAARKAMFPPFEISIFADPSGAFTTAAAMVACVEKIVQEKHHRHLDGLRVAIFGATGVVGYASAVIAALERSKVTIVGYDGIKRVSESANEIKARFNVEVRPADGSDDAKKTAILNDSEAVFCAGRAGVQILSKAQIEDAKHLLIAADVNAVPPAGVEGLGIQANGDPLTPNGAVGLGPLAIGNIKYKTEFALFQKMIAATKPVHFDFRDAFVLARELNV